MTDQGRESNRTEIGTIVDALEKKKYKRVRKQLRGMHPAKVASLLESLAPSQRAAVWEQIDDGNAKKVLLHAPGGLKGIPIGDAGGPTDDEEAPAQTELERLRGMLDRGKLQASGRLLMSMHPAKAAGLLESLPPRERSIAWNMVETEVAGSILKHLHDEVRMLLALDMESEELATAAGTLELDDETGTYGIVWRKPERLTSGVRDAHRRLRYGRTCVCAPSCVTCAYWMICPTIPTSLWSLTTRAAIRVC